MNGSGLPEFPGPWNHWDLICRQVPVCGLPSIPFFSEMGELQTQCEWIFFVCLVATAVLLLFFVPLELCGLRDSLLLQVLFYPPVEELVFRGCLIWWFCHGVLNSGFLAAFWWTFIAFLVCHIPAIIGSAVTGHFLRALDAISVGTFNSCFMPDIILRQGGEMWMALVACMLLHAIYNLVNWLLRHSPFIWLLYWIRLAALLVSAGVYWYCCHAFRELGLWQW